MCETYLEDELPPAAVPVVIAVHTPDSGMTRVLNVVDTGGQARLFRLQAAAGIVCLVGPERHVPLDDALGAIPA